MWPARGGSRRSAAAALVFGACLSLPACAVPWAAPPERHARTPEPVEPPRAEPRRVPAKVDERGIGDHEESVQQVVFTRDGGRLASTGLAKPVVLWSRSENRVVAELPHADRLWAIDFSPDGERLFGAGERGIWRWDLPSPVARELVAQRGLRATCLAVSPAGDRVAAGTGSGEIFVWDARTGERRLELRRAHESFVNDVAWSPSGGLLASAGQDGKTLVYDFARRATETIDTRHDQVRAVAFSPDGDTLAIALGSLGGGSVWLWDVATARVARRLNEPTRGWVNALAWAPGGRALVVGSRNRAQLWNRDGVARTLATEERDVTTVSWSPQGDIVAVGSDAGWVRIVPVRPGGDASARP